MASRTASHRKKLNSHADSTKLVKPSSRIDSTFIMKRDVSGMNETQVQAFLSRYNIGPATGSKKPAAQKKLSRK